MRKFLSRFIKPTIDPTKAVCTHRDLPEDRRASKLISYSRDECLSCATHICNICSEIHVNHHHVTKLNVNSNLGTNNLHKFNLGYLTRVDLNGLKCICGTTLAPEHIDHAICAACGMASCSDACHKKWQDMGNCTYSQNFYQNPANVNLRSIVLRNIVNIHRAKIKSWSVANKTSLSYIVCYASSSFDYVFLQRGFRNYGKPQQSLIERMKPHSFGLDYVTHEDRICDCTCEQCKKRSVHSVGNCQNSCEVLLQKQFSNHKILLTNHAECKCSCEFCSSGIVTTRHTKLQCLPYCYKSTFNLNRHLFFED